MTSHEKNITGLIKKKIQKIDPAAEIILFGSHARGDAHTESDWDILILLNFPKTGREIENKYRKEIHDVMYQTGEFISTLILSKEDWEDKYSASFFYENVQKEGKRL